MLLKMKVPSPGESISEVEILDWLVEDGDYVEKDQSIAEIDSDKATLELPAEDSGIIKILVKAGESVVVGDVICTIDIDSKKPIGDDSTKVKKIIDIDKKEVNTETIKYSKATPLAAAMLNEHDIPKKDLKGTGVSGKITKLDVQGILNNNIESRQTYREKMSLLRRKVSKRLVSVKNETAMLTTFNEVDMTAIIKIRKKYKDRFKEKFGVNLGFMSFFTKAVTTAIKDFKDINSMIDGQEIIHHSYVDIGIAVSAPKGLMVPVLRNAELMSFQKIENEINYLANRARDGKITVDEMLGGTFTITNGGIFGSMLSTPIINPPQSAILGMHNIVERPVVINGKIEIRPIMYVALSYDHRIIDGRESVGFLCRVKECLEDPLNQLMSNDIDKELEL